MASIRQARNCRAISAAAGRCQRYSPMLMSSRLPRPRHSRLLLQPARQTGTTPRTIDHELRRNRFVAAGVAVEGNTASVVDGVEGRKRPGACPRRSVAFGLRKSDLQRHAQAMAA